MMSAVDRYEKLTFDLEDDDEDTWDEMADTFMIGDYDHLMKERARVAQIEADMALVLLNAVHMNDTNLVTHIQLTEKNKYAENEKGVTPLIQAMLRKNYEMCKYLLSAGIDINRMTSTKQTALTALLHIVQKDKRGFDSFELRIVLLFLRYGADIRLNTGLKTAATYFEELGYAVEGIYLRKRLGLKAPTVLNIGDSD
jgi:hypothetical protein